MGHSNVRTYSLLVASCVAVVIRADASDPLPVIHTQYKTTQAAAVNDIYIYIHIHIYDDIDIDSDIDSDGDVDVDIDI